MRLFIRRFSPTLLAACGLYLLTLPALAQKPGGVPPRPGVPAAPGGAGRPGQGGRPGQRGGRGVSLATLPLSALELLTPLKADQKSRIAAIQTKARADLKTADRAARGPILTKANDDIKALLTPAQAADLQKSLPLLSLVSQSRAIPLGALGDVKLSKAQLNKILGFASATQAQLKGLRGPERQAQMQQVGPALKTQIEGTLTATQKSAIAKYEAAHPRRPRNGGPGGAPGAGFGNRPGSPPAGGQPKG